eukprot:TRINITY_DN22466_c1_g7_i2.p1 TRINITY_DN22466_c1_g7~~TRINITY_DN22466_c1_g7_i2.p1  ORF type:complete len:656 (-),score=209.64 TRINITY_DN22466_c1_g7_i2:171-2030(-)
MSLPAWAKASLQGPTGDREAQARERGEWEQYVGLLQEEVAELDASIQSALVSGAVASADSARVKAASASENAVLAVETRAATTRACVEARAAEREEALLEAVVRERLQGAALHASHARQLQDRAATLEAAAQQEAEAVKALVSELNSMESCVLMEDRRGLHEQRLRDIHLQVNAAATADAELSAEELVAALEAEVAEDAGEHAEALRRCRTSAARRLGALEDEVRSLGAALPLEPAGLAELLPPSSPPSPGESGGATAAATAALTENWCGNSRGVRARPKGWSRLRDRRSGQGAAHPSLNISSSSAATPASASGSRRGDGSGTGAAVPSPSAASAASHQRRSAVDAADASTAARAAALLHELREKRASQGQRLAAAREEVAREISRLREEVGESMEAYNADEMEYSALQVELRCSAEAASAEHAASAATARHNIRLEQRCQDARRADAAEIAEGEAEAKRDVARRRAAAEQYRELEASAEDLQQSLSRAEQVDRRRLVSLRAGLERGLAAAAAAAAAVCPGSATEEAAAEARAQKFSAAVGAEEAACEAEAANTAERFEGELRIERQRRQKALTALQGLRQALRAQHAEAEAAHASAIDEEEQAHRAWLEVNEPEAESP